VTNWKWWKPKPSIDRDISQEQREVSDRAKNALPVMMEVAAEVREALMDNIIKSGPNDYEIREYYYHAVKGLDAVIAMTEVYANRQNMAEAIEAYRKKVNQ